MNKFMVPYNFDSDLCIAYSERSEYIQSVFVPAFYDDCLCTRLLATDFMNTIPTREIYEFHIQNLINCGLTVEILMQEPTFIPSNEIIKYYVNLGVRCFTVGNDEACKAIKRFDDTLMVNASITQALSPNQINELKASYDTIILYFWYNRNISTIKNLPKKYKYTILVNSSCISQCEECQKHWFLEDCSNCMINLEKYSSQIVPSDLHYFDNYISCYKLQGRDAHTCDIIKEFDRYIQIYYNSHSINYYDQRTNFPNIKFIK